MLHLAAFPENRQHLYREAMLQSIEHTKCCRTMTRLLLTRTNLHDAADRWLMGITKEADLYTPSLQHTQPGQLQQARFFKL